MDYLQYLETRMSRTELDVVLNLIINGLPSILTSGLGVVASSLQSVLNLIINGLPSIHIMNLVMFKY